MPFTAAYLVRLAAWALAAAGVVGGPVWLSWRRWERVARGASADARHRAACGHFFALSILPVAAAGGVHLALAAMGAEISREPPSMPSGGDGPEPGWLATAVVGFWLAGALCAAARLAAGAWRLRRLRGEPAPASFAEEVRRLAPRARLIVRVAAVPVPQVTGLARAVLTVPTGFLRLPAAERDAVLRHELAHVARHDFAANLLQRCALAALWFQPAARALYHHVVREREARCDRLAIARGASPAALARALVRLAEARPPSTVALLAAAGGGDLAWRVGLLLSPAGNAPAMRRWQAVCCGIAALGLAGAGGARLAGNDRMLTDLYIASDLGPVVAVQAHDPGGTFGLRIHRGKVLAATVEDLPLPSANIHQRGDRVTLLGAAQEPVVSFRVTPAGRIEWRARLAGAPRG